MIKKTGCEREPQAVKAVKSGFTSEEVSAHLKSCASCRETAKIVRFFQANLKEEKSNLPAAGFVWWKSKIIEKQTRAARVAQPILVAQIAAAAAFFATLFWLLFSKSAPTDSLSFAVNRAAASVAPLAVPLAAAIICFALLCLVLVLALRRLLPEK